MEGVRRNQVYLMPHQKSWDEEFEQVQRKILEVWGENVLDIQHVGSTAIPSIWAKPILDVAVRLGSMESMNKDELEKLGYDYRGPQHGKETYHLFVLRGAGELSLHHIHCYDKRDDEFFQLVGFRDYLRAHGEKAAEYEALKKSLATQYPLDRVAYTEGKRAFIQGIYDEVEKNLNGSKEFQQDS